MRISVFGLGYVGAVSAACFAELGHDVIGVDIVDYKINLINKGQAPIKESDLDKIRFQYVMKKKLFSTKDCEIAVNNTDISFVCVGTPPKRNGDLDLTSLKRVCKNIGIAVKNKKYHIIVIRSTMFPGSLDELVKIIEDSSNKKVGKDFDIAVNPEFLREGSAVKDFFYPPYIIVGAENKLIGKKIFEIYNKISAKKFLVKPDIAQMIKYVSNSWHAVKVTFANEIGSLCKKLNINSKNLMKLFCEDTQLNLSSYYLMPGFAYGGSCLPKDTAALNNNSKKLNLKMPLIDSVSKSNTEHINRAISLIKSKKKKKVGILGLTFKPNTDDIRGNPLIILIRELLKDNYDLKIFDDGIDKSNIELLNKSYRKEIIDQINKKDLKKEIKNISNMLCPLEEVFSQDIIIISKRDNSLKKHLLKLPEEKIIIDLQNLFHKRNFLAKYETL
jgi:GDP-mannose 6-dehydrogenase